MARPPKKNEARVYEILQGLSIGMSRRAASALGGISDDTLRRWMKSDDTLAHSVERAEATASQTAVESIHRASIDGDWRAAAWWLERRRPEEWGKRTQIETPAGVSIRVQFSEEVKELE